MRISLSNTPFASLLFSQTKPPSLYGNIKTAHLIHRIGNIKIIAKNLPSIHVIFIIC